MTNTVETTSLSGADFGVLRKHIQVTFDENLSKYGRNLFVTKADGLSTIYVDTFPEAKRQHHNCTACRDFIRRFGHAVFITPEGTTVPALWNPEGVPDEYKPSIEALYNRVAKQGVKGVFFTEYQAWGTQADVDRDGWAHMGISTESTLLLPATGVGDQYVKHTAKKRENFELLEKSLQAFPLEVLRAGVNMLQGKELMQADRYEGAVKWLYELKKQYDSISNPNQKRNLVWFQVANVVDSYSRVGSTLVGTLLEDLRDGTPKGAMIRRFNEKADPVKYQRTVAAPTRGNVDVAIKLFNELGLQEDDLPRRIARPDELQYIWQPPAKPAEPEAPKAMFSNIKVKDQVRAQDIVDTTPSTPIKITMEKFTETVLPNALDLEMRIQARRIPVFVFTNAVKENAGRIYFYDTEEQRNTLSWFTKKDPVMPQEYAIPTNVWIPVYGITTLPSNWFGHMSRYGGHFFVGENFRNLMQESQSCIFPELLDQRVREARRVIERFSMDTSMVIPETDKHAIGVKIVENVGLEVRVTTEFGKQLYFIDRD